MSPASHTPGPWTFNEGKIFADGNVRIAEVDGEHNPRVNECVPCANARLISAAPDLYKACKTVDAFLDDLEAGLPEDDPLREIRLRVHAPLKAALKPAIAKAEK